MSLLLEQMYILSIVLMALETGGFKSSKTLLMAFHSSMLQIF